MLLRAETMKRQPFLIRRRRCAWSHLTEFSGKWPQNKVSVFVYWWRGEERGWFCTRGWQAQACSSICMSGMYPCPLLTQMEHVCIRSPTVPTVGDEHAEHARLPFQQPVQTFHDPLVSHSTEVGDPCLKMLPVRVDIWSQWSLVKKKIRVEGRGDDIAFRLFYIFSWHFFSFITFLCISAAITSLLMDTKALTVLP